MASSKKQTSYSILHVLFLTLLVGIFALMGTVSAIELLLRVLPSTEIVVEIVDRDSLEGSGYIGRGSGSVSWSYYITLRDENGKNYRANCPVALYQRALSGLSKLSDVRMKVSKLAGKPIEVSTVRYHQSSSRELYSTK
jgi:hypothetical protein